VTPTPSPSPPPVTLTPTPTPTPVRTVDLGQAVSGNLVTINVNGSGLTAIAVTLTSKSVDPLEVTIGVGTLFQAQSSGVQNMVVIANKTVYFASLDAVVSTSLSVACASMELDQPTSSDVFSINTTPLPADLVLLLNSPSFGDETFRVKQFAIWTITANPTRDGYVGLGTGVIGSGPSDAELASIRALFVAAGIVPEKYKALQ
jgi:hypothetical protein